MQLGPVALEPQFVKDSAGYERRADSPEPEDLFGGTRTAGYPLFLAGAELLGAQRSAVPELQAAALVAATFAVYAGVAAYVASGWIGLAAAAPLLWADHWSVLRRVQPDALGLALALVTLGCLLFAASRPRARWPLVALALACFAAYQVRPAYVLLIGFLPFAGLTLVLGSFRLRSRFRRVALPWLAGVTLASLLPFLLFASARWIAYGHFGLVPYGGFNAIGVTAGFLDRELVNELPPDLQPLGRQIWQRVRSGKSGPSGTLPPDHGVAYNKRVWKVAVPLAREEVRRERSALDPDDPRLRRTEIIEINDRLTRLARELVLRRPAAYGVWIRSQIESVTRREIAAPWVRWTALASLVALPLSALAAAWAERRGPRPEGALAAWARGIAPLVALLVVAVAYYLCHLLLVVAVEVPIERYVVATTPLVPAALAALAAGSAGALSSALRGAAPRSRAQDGGVGE